MLCFSTIYLIVRQTNRDSLRQHTVRPTGSNIINRTKFSRRTRITLRHCEFELDERGDIKTYPLLQTLICHRALVDYNVKVLLELVQNRRMPDLRQLHFHFDGLKSLTDSGCPNAELDRLCVGLLKVRKSMLENKHLFPEFFIQGIPFHEHFYKTNRFALSPFEMIDQLANPTSYTTIVHINFQSLPVSARNFNDLDFRRGFDAKFPCLQEVEVNGKASAEPTVNLDSFKFFLHDRRGVSKLTFIRSGFDADFFTSFLPAQACLIESLVVLKIYENLQHSLTSWSFVRNFSFLRYFDTNLLCKQVILQDLGLVAVRCPVTFSFGFISSNIDDLYDHTCALNHHLAIIRKVAPDSFIITIREMTPSDQSSPYRTHDLGIATLTQLKDNLNNHPICLRLLRHRSDEPYQELREGVRRQESQEMQAKVVRYLKRQRNV